MEDTSHSPPAQTQRASLRALLSRQPIVRAHEMRAAGISPETLARAVRDGELTRLSRGLYQAAHTQLDEGQSLAEAAKKVPRGVIAMTSALAFHGLTDQLPRKVWIAIGPNDWAPVAAYPPLRIVRFSPAYLHQGVEHHRIGGVDVPIYSVAKTLADMFRNSKLVDRAIAIEGLRAALDQRKVSPSAIAQAAQDGGAWKMMKPYLEALTSNG